MKKNIIIGFYTICSISILLLANWFLFIRDRGKLNIIFISVDTLRQDHLGIYGYNRNTSPNIDRYFKDSFIFKNAYTATPKTYASFVSLFTGLEPSQTNIFDYNGRPLKNTEKTLTQYLKEKNFNTAAFVVNGALHYSINNEETNLQKGFDYWDYLPYFEKANLINSSSQITKEVYEHRITKAIAWLRDNRKNNKFVWFHFIDPHSPYAPERKDICEVSPEVCHKILKANTVENIRLKYKGQSNGCYTTTPPKNIIDSLVKYYDAEIHYTDRLIGKLTKYFDISGISENSIIIFLADHGEGLDHGYYFQHGPLFDSNVKIPLIVKYPNTQGRTVKRLVANSDILPTIL
ncbi:MAG: sulfatase, partial [Bacteroidota bacterium]